VTDAEHILNDAFLPFDPQNFGFAGAPHDYNSQVDGFRQLNALIFDSNPPTGIKNLVAGMYHDDGTGKQLHTKGTVADLNFVPAAWNITSAESTMYTQVIKPYCRTCHLAQPYNGLDFTSPIQMETQRFVILNEVCKFHRMPHAQQTLEHFWTSPNAAASGMPGTPPSMSARAVLVSYLGRMDDTPLVSGTGLQELCQP
jgi:hypothetical protein